jgi:simple sugar transport system permease protein
MAEAAERPAPDERLARINPISALVNRPDMGAVIGAIAVFLLFAWTARGVGWIHDLGVTSQWSDQGAQYGIVAVPVALLMIGGEFDLSAGVMIGSSGLLLGLLVTRWDVNIWPAILIVMVAAAAIGFINGYVVVRTRLPSFIVTLGTFFILQGVNAGGTLKLTGTVAVNDIDGASGFSSARPFFASTFWSPYDFKIEIVWWLGLTAVGAFVLARTRFGNWIYAVGGDAVAARNIGVPVARTKIVLFMMTSMTSALLGIITAISLRSIQANEGVGREFIFIIAAVVGGCLLTGGYGSVIGAAFGSAILGMAGIGIILSQWDSNWVYAFQGGILMLAVMLNAAIRSRAGRARTR